jgi:hypothetical protein
VCAGVVSPLETDMTLMLHAGANPVTYEALRAVPVPAATDSHVPVPHHEIVELMRFYDTTGNAWMGVTISSI